MLLAVHSVMVMALWFWVVVVCGGGEPGAMWEYTFGLLDMPVARASEQAAKAFGWWDRFNPETGLYPLVYLGLGGLFWLLVGMAVGLVAGAGRSSGESAPPPSGAEK
ncbi:MAG: hypothetical protein A3K19_31880 [Lentisphaerae bacterium RIFOXYB12_FULL_65_16]|nr:MAG: hypothetical protein A3K18_10660 [Lentisphaerae bacterium RIFOXYA12_64_32]OGV88701.1 MAG: hypothetical protein A3K19_31880 [Lentisphaerae bacterium RIFOXYB12_FULL_65_16]